LFISLLIWFLAHAGLPINTSAGVFLALLVLIGVTWRFQRKDIRPALVSFSKIGWVVAVEEILFALGYFLYALVRGYQPEILGLEKFMDFGFIKSYLASPILPANDMWWAGSSINYYSFGHFWASILTRVMGVIPEVSYNLVLAFIMATGLSLVFSLVVNLSERSLDFARDDREGLRMTRRKVLVFSGVLGALLVMLGGNSHTAWSLIAKGSLNGYWYADATRFIYNTIHEFPAYSFVVSDLHGHLLGLPFVLVFLLVAMAWDRAKTKYLSALMGILLGVMVMTNTWDTMIYGLFLTIYGFLMLSSGKMKLLPLIKAALVVGGFTILTALPWFVGFKSISDGVAPVTLRSPIWQLIVLWGLHLAITIAALGLALKKERRNYFVLALGLCAISLLIIPEFIYIKDIYPNHQRANTMFKLTYQAFILMGILGGWVGIQVLSHACRQAGIKNKVLSIGSTICLMLMFSGLMIFPFVSFKVYYNSFSQYRGLDGFVFLKERYPADLSLIKYLAENRDGKNLVEAVGDSYTETDFVSAFSGVPTVVGWRVHEWLWRGGYDEVSKRDEEVRKFYEEGSSAEAEAFVKKYTLGWIVVSEREREKYKNLDEQKIKALGKVVFSEGSSYLIKIR
jgi:uncharacterized membrane protein